MTKYQVKELIDALSNPNMGSSHEYGEDKKLFFGGEVHKVKNSNIVMPRSEILGQI